MANCITYKPSPRDTLHHSEKKYGERAKGYESRKVQEWRGRTSNSFGVLIYNKHDSFEPPLKVSLQSSDFILKKCIKHRILY